MIQLSCAFNNDGQISKAKTPSGKLWSLRIWARLTALGGNAPFADNFALHQNGISHILNAE